MLPTAKYPLILSIVIYFVASFNGKLLKLDPSLSWFTDFFTFYLQDI